MKYIIQFIVLFCILLPSCKAEGPTAKAARLSVMEEEFGKAQKDGMPTGFMEAKWFMTPEELQKVRPKATKLKDIIYHESSEYVGRSANVQYIFDDSQNFLIMVLISFMGDSTAEHYQVTRSKLVEKFGEFPAPMPSERFELDSRLKKGRMAVGHVWKKKAGLGIEQVLIYRTK
jgi:hypothetical protein